MRAPIYNVGKLNNLMFGDVYDPETYSQEQGLKILWQLISTNR